MQARRLLTTLFAAAMFSTSCSAIGSSQSAAAPPPPPVQERINTEAMFPEDGLTRLIVTPIAGAPAEPSSSDGDGTTGSTLEQNSFSADPSRVLTPEMVAAMPPGAELEARDGQVGYLDAEGNFVAFDPASVPAPEPTIEEEPEAPSPEIVPLYGNPYIDELAADPAVRSVIVVGDGTYGIEVTDPSVVDPATFAVAEDVPLGITTDQYEPYQWSLENDGTNLDRVQPVEQLEDADLDALPTVGRADGSGIVVAVIDSGVDFSHSDLQNSAWSNLGEVCGNGIDDEGNGFVDDCNGWDFANNDASPFNAGADSHGTHVAGIITANRNGLGIAGLAPDARIMDLNVAKGSGSGMSISGASVTAAIRYAVDNGADIINLSLGSQPGTPAAAVAPMGAAIDYAASQGVLVVAAAGNNGVDLASLAVYPASFNRSNMLVVGASTPADTKADFSNYSAGIVDVYAPGVLMLSTVPGNDYRFMSGTSQASPATAAAAALVMQMNPDVSMDLIIDAVTSTVDRKDALSTSTVSGRVNAAAAIGEGEAPPIPTELDVMVSGLVGPSNEVTAGVEIITPPNVFDEDYRWELSLLYTSDAGVYAIIDHPFLVDGRELATGVDGAIDLGSADASSIALATNLPAGRYSFVIEAVPTADESFRLGDAFVTTFEIAGDDFDGAPPTTIEVEEPSTTAPGEGTTTTTGAGSSTPAPQGGQGSTPTTAAPGDSASPTTNAGGQSTTTAPSTGGSGSDGAGTGETTTTAAPAGGSTPTTAPTGGGNTPTTAAPSGGSTPTTVGDNPDSPVTSAPSNTAPTDTAPTDTAPTNTVPAGPAPVPDGLGSGAAQKGAWESTSVSPQSGYVNQANTVTIRGNFPSDTYVWFGGQAGQVVHQNRDSITVRTPLRATPGVVDITLQKSRNGVVLTIPDAYAFVAVDAPAPDGNRDSTTGGDSTSNNGGSSDSGSSDSGSNNGGSTDSGSNNDSDNDGSNGGGSDGGGSEDSTDSGSSEGDSTDDEATQSDRRARMVVGAAIELDNGLMGASVTPNLAAGAPLCSNDPCSAVRR